MAEASVLAGKEVALSGRLFSMSRAQAAQRILQAGGRPVREPGPDTAILVAGNAEGHLNAEGEVPRNLARFRQLKQQNAPILLLNEPEFLRLLGAQDELEDFSRLYTAEQVSRIAGAPLAEVRSWVRRGLLRPARLSHRLAWFDFQDILTARNLSRLTKAGVPASRIHRSLSEIAGWLPEGTRVLGQLEAYANGLRLRLPDGGRAEPSGQRLMDFQRPEDPPHGEGASPTPLLRREGASPTPLRQPAVSPFPAESPVDGADWFSQALEAEERGELQAAFELYSRALEVSAEPEVAFNLGNVLYELGREAQAAERYLQAVEADPEFAEAWNNLGNSLAAIGRLEDALKAYRMALSLEPDYPEPRCNLATVLDRLGRPAEALAQSDECRKAFPNPARLRLLRHPAPEEAED
jgi:tetratricopeptide (TPR) repeat protein